MQGQNDKQSQLWDAGPVKIFARSHKRGAPPVSARCREILPDGSQCPNMRRLAQGAVYCDEHARSKNYTVDRAPSETRVCSCGRTFSYRRRLVSAVSMAWGEFCPDCHNESPLTLDQLQRHNVPPALVREWLNLGADLACEICGKKFRNNHIRPVIDHDHGHCKGGTSCGECVRGVLCPTHNNAAGQVELLEQAGLLVKILDYLKLDS